jgi:nitrogen fixation negative regulator NifL
MNTVPTRLLLIEDVMHDAILLQALLNEVAPGSFAITCVDRLADALARIRTEEFDVVLSDLGLPDSRGLATVQAIVACTPMLPLVVLTGLNDDEVGRTAIQHGAQDFLVKGESGGALMARTIHFAIERKRFEVGLRAANEALAGRVVERTAELEAANVFLRESAERYRAVGEQLRKLAQAVEQSPVSIVITDRDARIEYVNPRFSQVTGYQREEAIGKNPRLLQSGQTPQSTYHELWNSLSEGSEWRGTFQNQRKNGELFWEEATISPMVNDLGEITHFVAVKEDITERKNKEAIAEREHIRLQTILATASDGIHILDSNGLLVLANEAFLNMLGYDDSAVGQLRVADWDVAMPWTVIKARNDELIARQGRKVFESRHRCRDGAVLDVEISASGIVIDDKAFLYAASRDITERKKFERALIVARDEAEASSRIKAAFLANMSHEIRTPMNGIMGLTELVLETELTPEQRENLELAYSSAQGLLRIINDVLDFSKVEAGKLELESLGLDLRGILDATLRTMSAQAARKGLRLVLRLADDIPAELTGDPVRLRQVIVNLIGNAIKFTTEGEVVLSVIVESADKTEVRLRFAVSDTGVGIPGDRVGAIFEAFTQVDSSITREHGGTGLGLSISSKLVALMKGHIWVVSDPGKGSTFYFTAAFGRSGAGSDPSPVHKAARVALARADKGLHILLAEDNPVNQKIAVTVLTKAGHRVTTAQNGKEAVDLALSTDFDAILMDLQMPVLDGFGATRAIRQHGLSIPIVALTAHAMKGLREDCLAAGMDDYLSKPFRGATLLAKLAELRGEEAGMGESGQDAPMTPHFRPSALLDLDSALRQTDGDAETVRMVAGMVATQIREDLPNLRQLALAQDVPALRDAVHRLKGSLASVGASAARSACLALEDLAKAGMAEEFSGGFARLEAELERVVPELIDLASQVGRHGGVENGN